MFIRTGKGFGALIGMARDEKFINEDAEAIHQWLAVAACIIALVYFVIYNLILAPRCAARPQHAEELLAGSASQNFSNGGGAAGGANAGNNGTAAAGGSAANGNNGHYSPLRVYHNERGKKGQFRF